MPVFEEFGVMPFVKQVPVPRRFFLIFVDPEWLQSLFSVVWRYIFDDFTWICASSVSAVMKL